MAWSLILILVRQVRSLRFRWVLRYDRMWSMSLLLPSCAIQDLAPSFQLRVTDRRAFATDQPLCRTPRAWSIDSHWKYDQNGCWRRFLRTCAVQAMLTCRGTPGLTPQSRASSLQ